jgi:hypothetical protein
MLPALAGTRDAPVPCEGCTACCTAGQFVTIAPDEADTLAHVPAELLFPAPHRPVGHRLIPHDDQGRCPMLGPAGCSIHAHRPRACRTYDCRIFAASGIDVSAGDPSKAGIADRVRRWRFDRPNSADAAAAAAVRRAARWLAEHPEAARPAPPGRPAEPLSATDRAALAVEIHDLFLPGDDGEPATPAPDEVAGRLARPGRGRPGPS